MEAAKTWLFFLYWVVLIAGSLLIFSEQYFLASIVRVMLMPVLAIYLFVSLKPTHSRTLKIFFFAAIAFLWISDIFRAFVNPNIEDTVTKDPSLIISLIGYGFANLFHILAFYKIRKVPINKAVYPSLIFTVGLALIYLVFWMAINPRTIGHFKYPWIVFIGSLIFVAAAASNIFDSNSRKKLSVSYFFPAAILSIIAAIVIVLNRYKLMEPRLDAVVVILYGYAQLLNANGFRKTAR